MTGLPPIHPLHADETGFDRAEFLTKHRDERLNELRAMCMFLSELLRHCEEAEADAEDHVIESIGELDMCRLQRNSVADLLFQALTEVRRLDPRSIDEALEAIA